MFVFKCRQILSESIGLFDERRTRRENSRARAAGLAFGFVLQANVDNQPARFRKSGTLLQMSGAFFLCHLPFLKSLKVTVGSSEGAERIIGAGRQIH